MAQQNQQSISWQAPEFKYYHKSVGWYIAVVCVAVLAVLFFVIVESDIFAAVTMAILAVLIIVFSRHVPETVDIELNERGVKFGSLFYPYKQLKYFWVVHNPRHQTINFHTSALINNVLILEMADQDPETMRLFLLKHLPEHIETEETAIQKLMHRFKF